MIQFYRPLKTNRITQGFGLENTAPGMVAAYNAMGLKGHNGVDFACYHGEPIYWNGSIRGTVLYTQNDLTAGVGCYIKVDFPEGSFKIPFWHFLMDGLRVKSGDILESGQLIGYGDTTGMSTGDHLHWGGKPLIFDPTITTSSVDYYVNGGSYYVPNKDNEYDGAVDLMPWFVNMFIVDVMKSLEAQIGLLQKVVGFITELLKKLLGR